MYFYSFRRIVIKSLNILWNYFMLKKFFVLFASCLALVLVVGTILIKTLSDHNLVEFWILLMLPSFGVPIFTAILISKTEQITD